MSDLDFTKDIDLSSKGLITLERKNIPEVVDGLFWCNNNKLTSLEFGPKEVGGLLLL